MQLRLVKTIYQKELRDILRDRRTLFVMVVLPIMLYPLLMIGFMQLTAIQMGRIAEKKSRVAVVGREEAGALGGVLEQVPGVELADTANWQQRVVSFELEAAVVIPAGFADSVAAGRMPTVGLYYNGSKEVSGKARERLQEALQEFKQGVVAERLAALEADTSLLRPFVVNAENLATSQQKQGDLIGRILGYLLIIMTLMGAFYPAIDLTAGEKERGTMETLLVSPASRADIVYGKFFAVMTIALITALLNLTSIGLTVIYGIHSLGAAASRALPSIAVSPTSLILSLALVVPLAVLFAAACLAIAVGARNYKEGQSLLSPAFSVVIFPAMVSLLPGTEMSPVLALIPVANVSLLIKEFMGGSYPWLEMLIAFASTSALAAGALWWATDQFKQEAVLFRHAEEIRWSPFRRPPRAVSAGGLPTPANAVLVFIGLILLLNAASARLMEAGVVKSLVVNELLIVGLPLLIVRRRGLDMTRVFALRRPHPTAWPAAFLLIIGGWLLAIELSALQNWVMPFPDELLRGFERFFAELSGMPILGALLLIGALPGVCEELLCRGFMMHAFLPRFGRTGAVVLAAIAFGLLHMDPYRLVATTFLGLLLGYIVVSTGSIFPAMLAHATNNALSFLIQNYQEPVLRVLNLEMESLQLLPWWLLMIGILCAGGGLFWLRQIGRDSGPGEVLPREAVPEQRVTHE